MYQDGRKLKLFGKKKKGKKSGGNVFKAVATTVNKAKESIGNGVKKVAENTK